MHCSFSRRFRRWRHAVARCRRASRREELDNSLLRIGKNGTGLTLLVEDEFLFSGPRVFDNRAYYATEGDESDLIRWVDIDNPGPPVTVVAAYVSADFELDACGVIYADVMDSQIWRKPR